jgi:hypothetical protein
MTNILMFDDVDVALLPSGFDAYAAYIDGIYANFAAIKARFPNAHILTIAVRATDVADALDIEQFDATNTQAPAWFRLALAHGVLKPCLYTSVSNVDALVHEMTSAGIPRSAYRLWSAHYGAGQHICGPNTCRLSAATADATQYTNRAESKSLDESLCSADFFTGVLPPPAKGEPTLTLGAKDPAGEINGPVHYLQERLNAWGAHPLLVLDADFGPATLAAVIAFQRAHALTPDGVVGPQTWAVLQKNPPVVQFAAPTGLRVEAGIISVSWDAVPDSLGHAPTGYTVTVLDAGVTVKTENVKGTTAVIDALTRNKVYELIIVADGGQGAPGSAKISVTA